MPRAPDQERQGKRSDLAPDKEAGLSPGGKPRVAFDTPEIQTGGHTSCMPPQCPPSAPPEPSSAAPQPTRLNATAMGAPDLAATSAAWMRAQLSAMRWSRDIQYMTGPPPGGPAFRACTRLGWTRGAPALLAGAAGAVLYGSGSDSDACFFLLLPAAAVDALRLVLSGMADGGWASCLGWLWHRNCS